MNEITRMEEHVSESMYSNRNDEIPSQTRTEIARLTGCVRALMENGVRVDEEMVMAAYYASLDPDVDMDMDQGGENESDEYQGSQKGKRLVAAALDAVRG